MAIRNILLTTKNNSYIIFTNLMKQEILMYSGYSFFPFFPFFTSSVGNILKYLGPNKSVSNLCEILSKKEYQYPQKIY